MEIQLIQHNQQKREAALIHMRQKVSRIKDKKVIMAIQEPYCTSKFKVNAFNKNYKTYYFENTKDRPRTCIFVPNTINSWLVSQYTDKDQTVVGIKTNGKTLYISSTYFEYIPNIDNPMTEIFVKLIEDCKLKNIQLITCIDSNSHHEFWSSTNNNRRGIGLFNYIQNNNLNLENVGNIPTFENRIRKEVLDITLTNNVNIVKKWEVDQLKPDSDHYMIDILIAGKCNEKSLHRDIRDLDIEEYKKQLESIGEEEQFNGNLHKRAALLSSIIQKAFIKACPLKKRRTGKITPWWTKELSDLKREVNKLRQRIKRMNKVIEENNKPEEEILNVKVRIEEDKKLLKDKSMDYDNKREIEKKKGWKEFTNSLNSMDATGKVAKLMKIGKENNTQTLKNKDGKYTTDSKETLELLVNTHFPDEKDTQQNILHELQREEGPNCEEINSFISKRLIKSAMKSFKSYKSPGPDGIYPILLHNLTDKLLKELLDIYKQSFEQGIVPKCWRETKVVFIPKPGKDDYTATNSFRPISLTSFFLKTQERLVLWYMKKTMKFNKVFNKNVFAYRKGSSTEAALHRALAKIERGYYKGNYTIGVLLDVDGAFNNTNINKLVQALAKTNVSFTVVKWVYAMLKDRKVMATSIDDKVSKKINMGTPQGSVLSPILFNLLINDLLKKFSEYGLDLKKTLKGEIFNFADDLLYVITCKNKNVIIKMAQEDINFIENWAKDNHFKFSGGKSKAMLFYRGHCERSKFKYLTIAGGKIEWVRSAKYLGIIIDDDLSFKTHFDKVITRGYKILHSAKKYIFSNYGMQPEVIKWMYEQLIRPIITYGAVIWFGAWSKNRECRHNFGKLERHALQLMTGAYKTVSTDSLNVLTQVTPVELYTKEKALKTVMRLKEYDHWIEYRGNEYNYTNGKIIDNEYKKIMGNNGVVTDKLKYEEIIEVSWNIVINEKGREVIPFMEEGCINVYTDGSKKDNGDTGYGYTIAFDNTKVNDFGYLGKDCSIFQAEAIGIGQAMMELLKMDIKTANIKIYVDNQGVLKCLKNPVTTNSYILDIKHAGTALSNKGNNITISWIKGHNGSKGNEIADRLAKMGTDRKPMGTCLPIVPMSEKNGKLLIEEAISKEWEERYKNRKGLRITKIFFRGTKSRKSEKLYKWNKSNLRRITKIFTGHIELNKQLARIHRKGDANCRCGEEEESADHYLLRCPIFAKERLWTMGRPFLKPWEVGEIKADNWLDFTLMTKRF